MKKNFKHKKDTMAFRVMRNKRNSRWNQRLREIFEVTFDFVLIFGDLKRKTFQTDSTHMIVLNI